MTTIFDEAKGTDVPATPVEQETATPTETTEQAAK